MLIPPATSHPAIIGLTVSVYVNESSARQEARIDASRFNLSTKAVACRQETLHPEIPAATDHAAEVHVPVTVHIGPISTICKAPVDSIRNPIFTKTSSS